MSLVRSELQPRLGLVGREDIVAAIDSLMRQDILTLTAIAKSRRETWPEVSLPLLQMRRTSE